jgi:hypothetical protein
MSLSIARTAEPPESWAALARARGLFYHHPEWVKHLARTWSYPIHCFTATREENVVGALAIAEVPGLFGPRRMVSLPFSYAAGPVALDGAVAAELVAAALDFAKERKIRRLEIKQRAAPEPPLAGMVRTQRYSTFLLDTAGGEAAVWERLHGGSTRRGIRKAEKEGVVVVRGSSEAEWTAMGRLEEDTAHRHGVPAPPRSFFSGPCRRLQNAGLADLYLARLKNNELAAGIVIWKGGREWIYAYGASRPETLASRPNHLLLWTAVKDAITAEVGFDLGRAAPEQEGLVEFKRRWGGQPVPLSYDYWPDASGLNVADRSQGSLALAARVWSRLPAGVTRAGSFLYRYLG